MKITNKLMSFILFLSFAQSIYAIPAIDKASFSGSLPRNLEAGNFGITFTVKGITALDAEKTKYLSRLKVYLVPFSESTAIPFDGETIPQGVFFTIFPNETLTKLEEDASTSLTYDFQIKQTTEGKLKDLVGDDGKLVVKIIYEDSTGVDNDDTFTLTRDNTVVNEAPDFTQLRPTFKKLVASWVPKDTITRTGSTTKPYLGVVLLTVRKDIGNTLTLPVRIFDAAAPEDTQTGTCVMNLDAEDGEACLSNCPVSSYLDYAAIEDSYSSREDVAVTRSSANTGSIGAGGLEIGIEYIALMTFEPDALIRSVCRRGTPVNNFTLSENYGEKTAKQTDPRCFIASSVYDSSTDPRVQIFRVFRDKVLLTLPGGQNLVDTYYTYSPPVAEWLDKNPRVKGIFRLVLDGFSAILSLVL